MSDANVQLVRGLHQPPEVDLAVAFADPEVWSAFAETASGAFVEDFECAGIGSPQGDLEATGVDGLRELWSDWLSPWSSYHSIIEEVTAAGDKVMVNVVDTAVARQGGVEIEQRGASVWTIRAGRVARLEFHLNRESARAAFEAIS